jgi:hypothetical protein
LGFFRDSLIFPVKGWLSQILFSETVVVKWMVGSIGKGVTLTKGGGGLKR